MENNKIYFKDIAPFISGRVDIDTESHVFTYGEYNFDNENQGDRNEAIETFGDYILVDILALNTEGDTTSINYDEDCALMTIKLKKE